MSRVYMEEMMQPGDEKFFIKSGNRVRLIEPDGHGNWHVERVDGSSKGKQMLCPESSLVDRLD